MRLTRRRLLGAATVATAGGIAAIRSRRRGEERRLEFGDRIDAETRERCRRVRRRTADIVGDSLAAPVRVELVDPEPASGGDPYASNDRIARALAAARHVADVERPDAALAGLGSYDSTTRTISLADVDPARLEDALDRYGIANRSPGEVRHSDTLVAHELAHAFQDDRIGSVRPADRTRDGRQAANAIVEGTAEYVEKRYAATCLQGTYDPCTGAFGELEIEEMPLWAVAAGDLAYRNGAAFVRAVVDEAGWEGVWERHRSPPLTTAEIAFPGRHLGGRGDATSGAPADVEAPEAPTDAWLRLGTDRLGVFALYTKLFALGVVAHDDSDAAVDPTVTAATTLEWAYRSSLLEDWRGDRFVAYGHADDRERVGYRWRTAWASADAARDLAAAVARGYDDRGSARDDGWLLDGGVHTLERDGRVVTFGMRPSP